MNTNFKDKLRRAALIHLELLELDKVYGSTAPSPLAKCRANLRIIKDGPWRARIIENCVVTNAMLSKGLVDETYLPAEGWSMIEVYVHNKRRLAFNVCEGTIVLQRYEPGLWENWFGVDNDGDTIPLIRDLFADEKDPRWRAFMASGLAQWPPLFDAAEFVAAA